MSVLFNLSMMPAPWEASHEIAASPPPDVVQTGTSVSPDAEVPLSIPSSSPSQRSCEVADGESARVKPSCGGDETYVTILRHDLEWLMEKIAELQADREADRIDHADYERLLEKERIERLEPMPGFLRRTA
jgi:hypothetical protein